MLAAFFIYRLSFGAIEKATFKSHITIDTGAQIVAPIILKVNIFVILISLILASLTVIIAYFRLRVLFGKIIEGLENLKRNNMSWRINLYGRKNTRALIKEFNQAASCLDKRLLDLRKTLDALLEEKELAHIAKLHNQLYSIVADKSR